MRLRGFLAVLMVLAAVTLMRNSLWHDDGTIWRDTIGKSPRKARAYNELGLHFIAEKDYPMALEILDRSLEINPYQPEIYINLGIAFEKTGRTDRAREAYQRALSYDPRDPTAYYNLGLLYYRKLHDSTTALSYLLKARDLDPLEPDVHEWLGELYSERGNARLAAREKAISDRLAP